VKTIVCYGDSNTWGYDPATRLRFPPDVRWTGVLQRELGTEYRVVEEGLNGRTTNLDDPIELQRNGRTSLLPVLESQYPFDLVTIMLGTNDLKARFHRSASDIAESAVQLARLARGFPFGPDGDPPQVLLIAPPPIATLTDFDTMFAGAEATSRGMGKYYKLFGERLPGVDVLDAGSVIMSSEIDGIHFEASEHERLGMAVATAIRRILQ
jgi:lysophospholipase L1-like esterase